MTRLSTALNSSLSGLALASKMTQTISNNVANALTEGYAARQVLPNARIVDGIGLGVNSGTIVRNVDPALIAERRVAEGQYALTTVRAEFFTDMERALGLPDDISALSNQVAGFGAALVEGSTRPESDAALSALLRSAQGITVKLNNASDAIQIARERADGDIATAVEFINTTLSQIADLNRPYTASAASSEKAMNQADQRQQLIDQLSEYVPVRELRRENGTIALFTPGGAILLDGRPVEFGFSEVGVITPDMAVGGALSGLTINGQAVDTSAESGKIAGGKLAALFDIRDVQAPAAQTQIDAVARDLIERFEDTTVDPTLMAGDPGLFTDAGSALVPADELGLAGRISVNALVDPAQGGDLWRLRDGLGALAPGNVGNATLINSMSDALTTARVPASGGFVAATSASALASVVSVDFATSQANFDQLKAFSASRLNTLVSEELSNGVDTDQEMQTLLLVEQAYAANARVISTIDELLETLLRI